MSGLEHDKDSSAALTHLLLCDMLGIPALSSTNL